ncbi:uncharacterized protein [Eucyclogobius newberryi]|uniref:uncharacterized protein n=1 Tax=Eucyclogobius newberryi TaxID=166745 RepID=UPI003B5A0B27
MSKSVALRALVNARLTAAAEEIFALVERTIAEYEEELCRSKEENQRNQQLLDSVLSSQNSHGAGVQFEPPRGEDFVPSSDAEEEQSSRRRDDREDLTFIPNILVKDEENLSSLFGQSETAPRGHANKTQQFLLKHFGEKRTDYDSDIEDGWTPRGSGADKLQKDEGREDHKDDSLETMLSESLSDNDGGGEHKVQSHECLACGEAFKGDAELHKHMDSHVSFNCPICGQDFPLEDEFKAHLAVHGVNASFSCSECDAQFALQTHLERHLKIHASHTTFSCPVCSKSFTRKYRLRSHMSSHTGEKPFSCPVCGRGFTRKDNLGAHMATHTGQKPFICAVCNKCFMRKDRLTAHMSSHTGEGFCLKKK